MEHGSGVIGPCVIITYLLYHFGLLLLYKKPPKRNNNCVNEKKNNFILASFTHGVKFNQLSFHSILYQRFS